MDGKVYGTVPEILARRAWGCVARPPRHMERSNIANPGDYRAGDRIVQTLLSTPRLSERYSRFAGSLGRRGVSNDLQVHPALSRRTRGLLEAKVQHSTRPSDPDFAGRNCPKPIINNLAGRLPQWEGSSGSTPEFRALAHICAQRIELGDSPAPQRLSTTNPTVL